MTIIPNTSTYPLFLSVCITSYNRVDELKRCLNSIRSTKYVDQIEIIISEDCSPNKNKIKEVVNEFSSKSLFQVVFNSNELNLGYDGNLEKLITLSTAEYILFLSDDDALLIKNLDYYFEQLKYHECALAFSPFFYHLTQNYERSFKSSFIIPEGIASVKKYIYCSILFSGLIFRRSCVSGIHSERFKNLMYFQVYLFSSVMLKHGGFYFDMPLIDCLGDGENAFGVSDSSKNRSLLANRKSAISNLEYHKGLIQTIKIFDKDNNSNVITTFTKKYSLRSYSGLSNATKEGKKELTKYWDKMHEIDLQLTIIPWFYYHMLKLFGYKICDRVMQIPKNILKYSFIRNTK